MDGAHQLANGFAAAFLGGIFIAYPATEAGMAMLVSESGSGAIWLSIVTGLIVVFWLIGFFAGDRFVDWLSENCTRLMRPSDYGD
ncbi:MAG: hypothetical protein AB8G99_10060 [Planctomycetaceae bacterium]